MAESLVEDTIQLDIPILLPELENPQDDCIGRLEHALLQKRGISQVHVTDGSTPQLCLHFDPNLISLQSVERCCTFCVPVREKILHFFEALCQFNTTLMLSAITSNSNFYHTQSTAAAPAMATAL